jgi:hypothetical protein
MMVGMRKVVALIVLAVPLAVCGGDKGHPAGDSASVPVRPIAESRTVLGLVFEGQRAELRRLDPLTLRPVSRARVKGLSAGIHAFSRDGSTLALASGDGPPRLRFVDLRTMRRTRTVDLPALGFVTEILWESPKRLLVLVAGEEPRVLTVQASGRVTGSQRLTGSVVAYDARAARLVALLAPRTSIGPSRLAVADAVRGLLGTVALPEISAGSERTEHAQDTYAMRSRIPGVAISPDGTRAVVVAAGSRVAEVELDTLRVSYHELSEPVSLLGRLRDWLEPEAQAKVVEGPHRFARFIDQQHVAVTGIDYRGLKDGEWDASAVGLRLIDTRDWSVRTLAEHVTGFVLARNLLLAFGGDWPEGSTGAGLRAYGPGGEERFHLLGKQPIGWVQAAWPYAYVPQAHGQGQRFDVVALASGQVVANPVTRRVVSILGPAGRLDASG